jgi:single-strand DNA-binding protein
MSINRVMVTGNLTKDPELRSTGGGMSVLKMRIAVNDRRKNPTSGEWEDVPNYFDVTTFGGRADSLARFLHKGSKIAVEGKLRWREWEAPGGDKRSAVEIIADDIEFLSSREGGGGGGYDTPSSASFGGGAKQPSDDLDGEEIPF